MKPLDNRFGSIYPVVKTAPVESAVVELVPSKSICQFKSSSFSSTNIYGRDDNAEERARPYHTAVQSRVAPSSYYWYKCEGSSQCLAFAKNASWFCIANVEREGAVVCGFDSRVALLTGETIRRDGNVCAALTTRQ